MNRQLHLPVFILRIHFRIVGTGWVALLQYIKTKQMKYCPLWILDFWCRFRVVNFLFRFWFIVSTRYSLSSSIETTGDENNNLTTQKYFHDFLGLRPTPASVKCNLLWFYITCDDACIYSNCMFIWNSL